MSDEYDHLPVDPALIADLLDEIHEDTDGIELDEPPLWRKRFERE
ncbi:hypothetical protein [Halobaculum sp. CBA1158]|nr:hypothetical protein [Halobaculum sp. CBA1158]